MTREFRIVPRMARPAEKSCTRYGFAIPNHPLGTTESTKNFPKGSFIAAWEDYQTAFMAASCLGLRREIIPVHVYVAELEFDL